MVTTFTSFSDDTFTKKNNNNNIPISEFVKFSFPWKNVARAFTLSQSQN